METIKKALHPGSGSQSTASGSTGLNFKGYAIHDTNAWNQFKPIDFQPKTWAEEDVEIAITHCGVCGTDVHTITGGWGEAILPVIPGHEIIGTAVRVGSKVQGIKVGDRVGVGAQVASCYKCKLCKSDNENYCPEMLDTYNAKYPDGVVAQGGYATGIRAHQLFVFPIPDALESRYAASMLCAGLTVFSPLVREGKRKVGTKVGIIGIGGLGHFAVLFGKALGYEVFALTHSHSKDEDIKKMGADHIIVTENEGWEKEYKNELDFIISTRDVAGGFDLAPYISTLNVGGKLVSVGLPDDNLDGFHPTMFMANMSSFGSSHIGSKAEAIEMLELAAAKGVKPWIEELPMSRAAEAVEGLKNNKVRYRYVLHQDLA